VFLPNVAAGFCLRVGTAAARMIHRIRWVVDSIQHGLKPVAILWWFVCQHNSWPSNVFTLMTRTGRVAMRPYDYRRFVPGALVSE
jgi:hypothetical protein